MSIKDSDFVCPKCGESNCVEMDFECDFDGARIKYECSDCGTKWVEFFALVYDGYLCEDKLYDRDGKLEVDYNELRERIVEELEDGSN